MKKIAIIGCGKIFSKHYEAIKIQKRKKMRLVAVCDKNNTLLNQIKDKTINKYTNLNDLFKNEKLDLISILTPSGFSLSKCYKVFGVK